MRRLGLVVVIVAVGLLALGIWRRVQDPFGVEALLGFPPAGSEWTSLATQALSRSTAGTRFENKWQLGALPKEGWLTVILFDSKAKGRSSVRKRFKSNCTYLGGENLIACDIDLIRTFLGSRDLDKETFTNEEERLPYALRPVRLLTGEPLRTIRLDMLTWVLGHEIGHILAGHGEAHFGEGNLEQRVEGRTVIQRRELEADEFLATRFSDVDGKDNDFYFFLISILQNEINSKACPDRSPIQPCENLQVGMLIFEPNALMKYSTDGTHPEYIIRAIRLIDVADRKYGLGIVGPLNRNIVRKLVEEGEAKKGRSQDSN